MLRKFSGNKLLWKLSTVIICLVAGIGVFSAFLLNNVSQALHEEFQYKGIAIAKNLADNCVEPILNNNRARLHDLLINNQQSEKEIIYAVIFDSDNKIIARSFSRNILPEFYLSNVLSIGKPYSLQLYDTEDGVIVDIAVPVLAGNAGVVHVGLTEERIHKRIADLRIMTFVGLAIASLVGIIISIALSALITQPIIKFAKIAKKIGQGDLNHKINIDAGGELEVLATAFNQMIINLRKNEDLRNQITSALRKSEESYRTLAENQQGAVFRKHLQSKSVVKFFNKMSSDLVGWSGDDVTLYSFDQKIHRDDLETVKYKIANAIAQRESYIVEYRYERSIGEWRYFRESGTPVFNNEGKAIYVDGLIIDITEQKKTEDALRESTALYRLLIENIDLGVTYIDNNFNVIMSSSSQGKFYRKDPSYFVGKKCYQVFQQKDKVCPNCPGKQALENGRIKEAIVNCLREDGTSFMARSRAFPIVGTDNRLKGYISLVEDISERLKYEANLKRAQQLEALGILAGGIAHDFNNLLTAVYGNIELAKMGLDKSHGSYKLLTEAGKASERSTKLTAKLLTFAKGGDPIKRKCRIDVLIKNSLDQVLADNNIEKELRIEADLYEIELDSMQIEQVLGDIFLNAKEAMPDGGKVVVSVQNTVIDENSEVPLAPGKYINLSIKDNGCGIKPEMLPMIFDPYFSSKDMCTQKGQGLGLAICHSVITRHKGYIGVDSVKGEGTCVNIYLPALSKSSATVKMPPIDNWVLSENKRVLIMDDEESIRQVTGEMLNNLGISFELAETGEEAVEIYSRELKGKEPFNLVILDLMVFEGMGGEEANRRLFEIDPEVKTVVASGYVNDPIMTNCQEYGFRAALAKPFDIRALQKIIAEV